MENYCKILITNFVFISAINEYKVYDGHVSPGFLLKEFLVYFVDPTTYVPKIKHFLLLECI